MGLDSRTPPRSRLRSWFANGLIPLIVAGLSLVPGPASAAFDKTEQKCRASLAKHTISLATTSSAAVSKCHAARRLGRLPAPTNCNDPGVADTSNLIDKALSKLQRTALKKCYWVLPSRIGFHSCPVPCESTTIDAAADIADCLACVVEQHTKQMASGSLGNPAPTVFGDRSNRRCHSRLAKTQLSHIRTVLKSRAKCQKKAEKTGATETVYCADSDISGGIGKGRSKASSRIGKSCQAADLAVLDSCLRACVLDEAETVAGELFEAIHPSLSCGNERVDAGEECDDGNLIDGDGCSRTCEFECGDAVLEGGEVCDD
ncbi:MAG: hypothetical protein ACE5D3_08885, partial [Candidatus Binatia bacterium]